jgi:hypothetical protein
MDRRSTEQLRLDRRLIRRREWITREELERALAELPDGSHKAAPVEERKDETPPEADPVG